jgi:hypothetical protein
MLCQWEITRAPGPSSRCSFGRSARLSCGDRKSITTLTPRSSVPNKSWLRKRMRSATPAACAFARASAMRSGSMSTHSALAP